MDTYQLHNPLGFKYLFVIVDLATNKFEIEPIKNKESITALNVLKNVLREIISKSLMHQ